MSAPSGSGSGSGTPIPQPTASSSANPNATPNPNPNDKAPPKAIASMAKPAAAATSTTRLGATKMKFVPVLPGARKKEVEVKTEPTPATVPSTSGRGRGAGRGAGRGRGRGDGPRPPPAHAEMTASGPFAMGPVAAGMSGASRRGPSSNFITPMGQPGGAAALGKNLGGVQPALASAKGDERDKGKESDNGKGKGKEVKKEDKDEEVYSDADDGVEIVDMEDVKTLDWMAPDSLRRVREGKKVKKIKVKVKLEDEGGAALDVMDADEAIAKGEVDLANAVNLDDSESEEELEDIMDDFTAQDEDEDLVDGNMRPNRLFLFQFPAPFPTFVMPPTASTTKAKAKSDSDPDPDVVMAAGGPVPESGSDAAATPILAEGAKRVAFAADVKPAASGASGASSSKKPSKSSEDKKPTIGVEPAEGTSAGDGDSEGQGEPTAPVLDGVIGEMEIRRSGAVTMRMGDGRIVYEVVAGTQPSFLQQVVLLDKSGKRLIVLGEVSKQFVCSPDVDVLLAAMNAKDVPPLTSGLDDEGLYRMDIDA